MIVLIIILSIIGFLLVIGIIAIFLDLGIKLCKNNNAVGIIYLFLALNILGLVIGCSILYNAKNGMYIKKESRDLLKEEIKIKEKEKKPN